MIVGKVTHVGRMSINGMFEFGVFVKTSGRSLMSAQNKSIFKDDVIIISDRRKRAVPTKYERRSV